jgi:hypothetical protein
MSIQHTPLTQAQFDALNLSNNWHIIELDMSTLKATPGIQRIHDVFGGFISGSLTKPKTLNSNSAVIGFDVFAHEPRPHTHKGEGSLNVYHYTVERTEDADLPFVLSGGYRKEALLSHWAKELDLAPYGAAGCTEPEICASFSFCYPEEATFAESVETLESPIPMPWSDPYKTTDSETGKETTAAHKTDEKGNVSDFVQGLEHDKKDESGESGKHGHAWNLNKDVGDDGEDPIGGRDVQERSKKDD